MTLYATPVQLQAATSALELAQLATPAGQPTVDAVTFAGYITALGVGATGNFLLAYNELTDALTRASALIDTRLASRYTLPLTVIPTVLVDYATILARFTLADARATDEMRYRFERVMKDLDMIAKNQLNIGAVGTGSTGAGTGIAFISGGTRDNTYTTVSSFENAYPAASNTGFGCGC